MLFEARNNFRAESEVKRSNILFSDFLLDWLEIIKNNIEVTTYANYALSIKNRIAPYFKKQKILLIDLNPKNIQDFYTYSINKTITIKNIITTINFEGKSQMIEANRTKNKASYRSLPLVPKYEELLLKMKGEQEHLKSICGRSYNKKFVDYICIDEIGNLIKPDYISRHFSLILKNHDMKHIRFHDLRHSCASLLLANGISMKEIQEWLGHSNFSTTANIYAHLDQSSKMNSANILINAFNEVT